MDTPAGDLIRGVGFVGTYLPRKCGIATFTYDLAEAVSQQLGPHQHVDVVAMDDRPGGYEYPDRVQFRIRENSRVDYSLAAKFLNQRGVDVVSLQHEYGIFGDGYGANIIALLKKLDKPVVVTCHTVLERPEPEQRKVLKEIASIASRVVVMSERAVDFLGQVYDVDPADIDLVPHGIHPFPFVDSHSYKGRLGLQGDNVFLSFGLLHRNKGIEHMIAAMPEIVARYPNSRYVVLGATHPSVKRDEGESYRLELQELVRKRSMGDHVIFIPRFLPLVELLEFIGASDVCITPYASMDHISSGALSYGMAMGKAMVSTPYTYAKEVLSQGRGRLVPPADPDALAREIISVLGDEHRTLGMRKRAYAFCLRMSWPVVARSYIQLFENVCNPSKKKKAPVITRSAEAPAPRPTWPDRPQ